MGSLSIWHWLIVLLVIILIFGTQKLSNIGFDVGKAIKGFKDGVKDAEEEADAKQQIPSQMADKTIFDIEARESKK